MRTEHCPNCGASLSPSANYCSECGEAVNDDSWGSSSAESSWAGADDSSRDGADDLWTDSSSDYASGRRPEGDTTLAAITHVLAMVTWVVGPFIVLVATEDPFVEENARNALNWQIMFMIYMIVSLVLVFVVVGVFLAMIVSVVDLVFCILAATKAADGEAWSYPATPDIV